MGGQGGLGALGVLGAVVEQGHARPFDPKDNLGVGRAHPRELDEHLRGAVSVGAKIEQGRHPPRDARQGAREGSAMHALDTSHAQGSGGEDGPG